MQKKPITIISILCVLSLVFGYWSGKGKQGSVEQARESIDIEKNIENTNFIATANKGKKVSAEKIREIRPEGVDQKKNTVHTATNSVLLQDRFELVRGKFTWEEAKAAAKAKGGHLATITSPEEDKIIENLLLPASKTSFYWLGGTDRQEEGDWIWITGESWNYARWSSSSGPDDGGGGAHAGEDFLICNAGPGGYSWGDTDVRDMRNNEVGYILELPAAGTGFMDKEENYFRHSYKNCFEPDADKFIFLKQNLNKVREGSGPTYWRPINANQVAHLTYCYTFKKDIVSAELYSRITGWGAESRGGFFVSIDGENWVQLKSFQNSAREGGGEYSYQTYHSKLPRSVLGTRRLFIRATLSPNSQPLYIQFARSSVNHPPLAYKLEVSTARRAGDSGQ